MGLWDRLAKFVRGAMGSGAGSTAPGGGAGGGCDHRDIHLRQGTPEFELFIARAELEQRRDLPHGAGHLANLLSFNPGNPEWVQLLEDYCEAWPGDQDELIPRGEQLYYATEGMRAYMWRRQGRLEEAIDLLTQVVGAKPSARYLEDWGLRWLEQPGAVESLSPDCGGRLFSLILSRYPEACRSTLPRLRDLEHWTRLAQRFLSYYRDRDIGLMLAAGLFRKAGLYDEGLELLRSQVASPTWHTATAEGLLLRQLGRIDEAERAFQQALASDSTDVSARLEAGDTFFERDEWRRALGWYENAIGVDPRQPWATASSLFCRWKLTEDEAFLKDLVELAKQGNERAAALLHGLRSGLPEPVDATANLLRQFRQQILETPDKAPVGECELTLSSLEAPSNFLAFRLEMEALSHDLRLKTKVSRVPRPDPRAPAEPSRLTLWHYQGTDAVPALPLPDYVVQTTIAALAECRYDPGENWAGASRVARGWGRERVADILATMVHPPRLPEGWSALQWLPRVQETAMQIAAQLDDGWEGATRREALVAVLLGPTDWATLSAIRALTRIAHEEESLSADIGALFQRLMDRAPDNGYCCWLQTLLGHWVTLPHLFDNERQELEQMLRRMESQEDES